MLEVFHQDSDRLDEVLQTVQEWSKQFLKDLEQLPVVKEVPGIDAAEIPRSGTGALSAWNLFMETYGEYITANTSGRYLGFVTGGNSPAALMADWLTSVLDMNATDVLSVSFQVDRAAIACLHRLFSIPPSFQGTLVTGATMANFTGLAVAREWWGEQQGVVISEEGTSVLPAFEILTCQAHSSSYKAISMLGIGRKHVRKIPVLPGREAVDVNALEQYLEQHPGRPHVFIASAGTVNTADFDDLVALVALKARHQLYIHLDAAFGGFAACSDSYAHLMNGWAGVDSITIDGHKWMNIPYDGAAVFTKHRDLQLRVFQNPGAAYLGDPAVNFNFINYGPENSRRLRALPIWFSCMAYGKDGFSDLVDQNIAWAKQFGQFIERHPNFKLLAPVHLNVVCFAVNIPSDNPGEVTKRFLTNLHVGGEVFLTPSFYNGSPAIRAAFVNWRTSAKDLERLQGALEKALEQL
ncbi:aspartate aminotransferase family protein [Chitinophaga caeni]|uniref:Aspartate aminotransferase family protein n=1 Tax=Chitinophaga caeni TaxID=2029983 RepID=A0A291QZF5_9BACT|nr:pyridoxal-dependent decarboxylase [Chitinophaga caeni]ATL49328.1 aspartate aminotransferase family protein [Chitinophaga caeni]